MAAPKKKLKAVTPNGTRKTAPTSKTPKFGGSAGSAIRTGRGSRKVGGKYAL